MDADDLFADLLGPAKPERSPSVSPPKPMREASPTQVNHASKDVQETASQSSMTPPVAQSGPMYVMLKEDAQDYVQEAVQKVVDQSMGKLVGSVRAVLESVTARMQAVEIELKDLKSEMIIKNTASSGGEVDFESLYETINARFSKVDDNIKDIGRSVQAMRDRAELLETQAELEKLQHGETRGTAGRCKDCTGPPLESSHSAAASTPVQPAPAPSPPAPQASQAPSTPHTPHAPPHQPVAPTPFQSTQPMPSQPMPASPPPHSLSQVPPPAPYAPPYPSNPPPAQYTEVQRSSSIQSSASYQPQRSQPMPPQPPQQYPQYSAPPPAMPYHQYQAPPPHLGAPSNPSMSSYPSAPPPPGAPAMAQQSPYNAPRFYGQPATPSRGPEEKVSKVSTASLVQELCSMGFNRWKVESTINELIQGGQNLDLNAIVDRLMADSRGR